MDDASTADRSTLSVESDSKFQLFLRYLCQKLHYYGVFKRQWLKVGF